MPTQREMAPSRSTQLGARLLAASPLQLVHAPGRGESLGPVVPKVLNEAFIVDTRLEAITLLLSQEPLECHPLPPLYLREAVRELGQPGAEHQE